MKGLIKKSQFSNFNAFDILGPSKDHVDSEEVNNANPNNYNDQEFYKVLLNDFLAMNDN